MTEPVPTIASRGEFATALRWGFEQATRRGARRIVCVDRDFAEWPLDDVELHARLAGWMREPLRRLVLLANNFDAVPRRQPRFVAWRAPRSHAVEAWSPADGVATELPTLLFDDTAVSVQLFEALRWRGRAALDPRAARLLRDRTDAILQRSEPAFAVNRLGL